MIVFLSGKTQLREVSFTPGVSTDLTQHDIFVISTTWLPVAKSAGNVSLRKQEATCISIKIRHSDLH